MASVRSLKPSDTYLQWCESLWARMTPPKKANAISLKIVMDTYRKMSIKEGTRRCRGNTGPRTLVTKASHTLKQEPDCRNPKEFTWLDAAVDCFPTTHTRVDGCSGTTKKKQILQKAKNAKMRRLRRNHRDTSILVDPKNGGSK
eukprot:gene16406-18043_t